MAINLSVVYGIGLAITLIGVITITTLDYIRSKKNKWAFNFDDRDLTASCFALLFWPLLWTSVAIAVVVRFIIFLKKIKGE